MNSHELTEEYIRIRERRNALKAQYDEADGALKAQLQHIEGELLRILNESGMDSAKTPAGTFYKQEEITPTGADWDTLYRWIAENDAFEALEKRIKKTFVKEYMAAHDGGIPPGVSVYREFVVRVRRS